MASLPLHLAPSLVEQEHIKQALDATQTAMSAIQTISAISQWTLGVLGVVLAVIAIAGWGALRNAVKSQSEQIANKKLDAYLESDKFKALLTRRVEESIKVRWQNTVIISGLREDTAQAGDTSPFPEG